MALYYFDIRDSNGVIADEEGTDCQDLPQALIEAEASARDIIKQFVTSKSVSANTFVDVLDDKRAVVASIRAIETIESSIKSPPASMTDEGHAAAAGLFAAEMSRHRSVQLSIARERAAIDIKEAAERRRWNMIKAHHFGRRDQ